VWSVALNAAEMWTLTQGERDRIEAQEIRIWRRMEKNKLDGCVKRGCIKKS